MIFFITLADLNAPKSNPIANTSPIKDVIKHEHNTNGSTPPILLSYKILKEDIYDAPVKSQVSLNILVPQKSSENELRSLLTHLYSKYSKRNNLKYHDYPTNIYIYAYTNQERANSEMGQWLAMLAKSSGDIQPTFKFNDREYKSLNNSQENRFGLSESKRKLIWREIILAEDRARQEAETLYPLTVEYIQNNPNGGESQLKKQSEMLNILSQKYKNEIAKKYSITINQLKHISVEGLEKDWTYPKH